jgi:hypothetical protein
MRNNHIVLWLLTGEGINPALSPSSINLEKSSNVVFSAVPGVSEKLRIRLNVSSPLFFVRFTSFINTLLHHNHPIRGAIYSQHNTELASVPYMQYGPFGTPTRISFGLLLLAGFLDDESTLDAVSRVV